MIKFNHNWIRPFQISIPQDKGGESQPYLYGCYRDMADVAYELLSPYQINEIPEIFPGICELNIKAELLTPSNTNILIVTHPDASVGKAPVVLPTSFKTDWWVGGLKIWLTKSNFEIKVGDPLALLIVVKRSPAIVSKMNEEEEVKVKSFNDYLTDNANKLKTREDNTYERMSWLVETGQASFKPKKKYKLL